MEPESVEQPLSDLVAGSTALELVGAHAVEEWVDLESVRNCVAIHLRTAETFCS